MDTQEVPSQPPRTTDDLVSFFRTAWARKWLMLVFPIVLLAAALGLSFASTPQYRATAQLLYQRPNLDSALFGSPIFQSFNKDRDVQTGARLVKLESVAGRVRQELSSPRSTAQLLDMVSVQPDGQTDVITISAVSTRPREAAQVANAFAEEFVAFRRAADQRTVAEARKMVVAQLEGLRPEERSSDYASMLREKIEELRILETMQNGGFEVVQQASTPAVAFSPQPMRNGVLAVVVGLILGACVAFFAEHLDKRIKDEEGMEREFGLPVLAAVPSVGGRWGGDGAGRNGLGDRSHLPIGFPTRTSPLLEPFRTLRSNLQYFNIDRSLRVILITSALPQQGKTITTLNLGLSLALSGERVIMVESDLRRPMLHSYLGLANDVGVTSILAGTSSFGEAMQLVQVEDYVAPEGLMRDPARLSKNLYCITSGPLPPNPAELTNSRRMQDLLDKATASADYVLIDTPPLLLVADALSLAKRVDGVIVAARANSSTRDEAKKVTTMLGRVGAHTVGLVVGGVSLGRGNYYYKYGYYQEQPAE